MSHDVIDTLDPSSWIHQPIYKDINITFEVTLIYPTNHYLQYTFYERSDKIISFNNFGYHFESSGNHSDMSAFSTTCNKTFFPSNLWNITGFQGQSLTSCRSKNGINSVPVNNMWNNMGCFIWEWMQHVIYDNPIKVVFQHTRKFAHSWIGFQWCAFVRTPHESKKYRLNFFEKLK